jgi:hypothetical protein
MGEPFSAILSGVGELARKGAESSFSEALAVKSKESSITLFGPADQLQVINGTSLEGLRAQNIEMLSTLRQTLSTSETSGVEQLSLDRIRELGQAYNDEVQRYSAAGEIRPTEVEGWEKVSPSEYSDVRKDWAMNKSEYIKNWEELNGKPWPTYSEDYVQDGKVIRKEGQPYDGHHVQPVEFGGKNSAENITPIHAKDHFDHQGIHRPDGPYSELARQLRNM